MVCAVGTGGRGQPPDIGVAEVGRERLSSEADPVSSSSAHFSEAPPADAGDARPCECSAATTAAPAITAEEAESLPCDAHVIEAALLLGPRPGSAGPVRPPPQPPVGVRELLATLRLAILLKAQHCAAAGRAALAAVWGAVVAGCRRAASELPLDAARVPRHEVAAAAVAAAGVVGLAQLLTAVRKRQEPRRVASRG